jgi:hypothetical protein
MGTERGPGVGGMEFTWRMIATLAWPAVIIVTVFVFRKWINERLESLGITLGSLSVQVKALNSKVNTVGRTSRQRSQTTCLSRRATEFPRALWI